MSMTSQPVTEIDGALASGQTMFSSQEDGLSWVSTLQPLIACGTNNGGNNVVECLWKFLVEIKTLLKVKVNNLTSFVYEELLLILNVFNTIDDDKSEVNKRNTTIKPFHTVVNNERNITL